MNWKPKRLWRNWLEVINTQMKTTLHIDIDKKIIELQGREKFVREVYEDFKKKVLPEEPKKIGSIGFEIEEEQHWKQALR